MNTVKPFSCIFSPQIPELLNALNCSLAISTYQAGKVIFISPHEGNERLIQLPRTFNKPMGISFQEDDYGKMAIACKDEVIIFRDSKPLAQYYPKSPNTYDSLYMPRVQYKTNYLDIHDIAFGDDGIYGVNTLFSCIIKLSEDYNFEPVWQPKFISKISSEASCHLNGMIMEDGKPCIATCFNQGDTQQSWRKELKTGGVMIDIESNELIATRLAMPHSPRLINGKIYCLMSATGELVEIDRESGKVTSLVSLNGFVRGMCHYKDYLFVGLSKLRANSSTFAELMPTLTNNRAGIAIIHLPTASLQGEIIYETSVDEIYDVQVLPDSLRPNIMSPENEDSKLGVTIPATSFWARKPDK